MYNEIIEKVRAKGWNVYWCLGSDGIQDFARRGPAENLEEDSMYVVFPRVRNPKNTGMLKRVAKKISRGDGPVIKYKGANIPFCVMRVRKNYIVVRHIIEDCIPYNDFLESLDSLNAWNENGHEE